MTTTILTDEQIAQALNLSGATDYADVPLRYDLEIARAIEQAVLQSIANDPNRINAAAKALSRHMDYPWEFMAVEGRDNMRRAAMITINAAMEKQP